MARPVSTGVPCVFLASTMSGQSGGDAGLGWLSGLRAFVGGITFIVATPAVWGYALVPAGMVLLLALSLGLLGVWGASQVSNVLFASSIGISASLGNWVLTIVLALSAIMAAIIISVCLAQPLSGFALEAIVGARERTMTGWAAPRPGTMRSALRSVWIGAFTLAVAAPTFATLFLINFFFPPALAVTVPVKFLLYAILLAWTFLDYPLGIRGLGVGARLRWVLCHFDAFCIFGLLWAMVGLVPGTFLFLLPMGVAGAAQLVVDAEGLPPGKRERLDFAK